MVPAKCNLPAVTGVMKVPMSLSSQATAVTYATTLQEATPLTKRQMKVSNHRQDSKARIFQPSSASPDPPSSRFSPGSSSDPGNDTAADYLANLDSDQSGSPQKRISWPVLVGGQPVGEGVEYLPMLDAQGRTILEDESKSEGSEGEEEEEMWLNLARLKDKMVLHSQDEEAQTGGERGNCLMIFGFCVQGVLVLNCGSATPVGNMVMRRLLPLAGRVDTMNVSRVLCELGHHWLYCLGQAH
jgi:hypothetical protein